MSADVFLDSNILVYAAVPAVAESAAAKRERALRLIEEHDFGLSTQVLQEFYVTVVHKAPAPLSPAEALEWIEQFDAFPCQTPDRALVRNAAELSQRYRIHYWDGAILAAAMALGAGILFTEDLNDGQLYDGVRAVNPFADAADPARR